MGDSLRMPMLRSLPGACCIVGDQPAWVQCAIGAECFYTYVLSTCLSCFENPIGLLTHVTGEETKAEEDKKLGQVHRGGV